MFWVLFIIVRLFSWGMFVGWVFCLMQVRVGGWGVLFWCGDILGLFCCVGIHLYGGGLRWIILVGLSLCLILLFRTICFCWQHRSLNCPLPLNSLQKVLSWNSVSKPSNFTSSTWLVLYPFINSAKD